MTTTEIVVFSSVLAGIFLLFSVVGLIYWARIEALHDVCVRLNNELAQKAQPKQLEEAKSIASATADRVDNQMVELRKFREGIHAEMQRFYGIMRRNEKATRELAPMPSDQTEDQYPNEISPEELKQQDQKEENLTRAQLRDLARKKGMRI